MYPVPSFVYNVIYMGVPMLKEIFLNVSEFLLQKFADFAPKLDDELEYLVYGK